MQWSLASFPASGTSSCSHRLVEELTPEEVEAVFGHEVGHVKHHHILFYVGFFLLECSGRLPNLECSDEPGAGDRGIFSCHRGLCTCRLSASPSPTSLWFLAFFLDAANARRMSSAVGLVLCARADCESHGSDAVLPPAESLELWPKRHRTSSTRSRRFCATQRH